MTQNNPDVKIIGITGNSGSGKSYIANKLAEEESAFVISADDIAHQVIEPDGAAYNEVLEVFGKGILAQTGRIDRKILGSIVFSDPEKRELLEQITHKHIIAEIDKMTDEARKSGNNYKYIVIDAPLLIEANMQGTIDEVWVVRSDIEKRLERVMARDGISREDAMRRFASQTPFEELAKYADRVVEN